MSRKKKRWRPSRSGTSKPGSKDMQQVRAYLRPFLPPGWRSFFSPRHAGRWWGLVIECPVCEERPPMELSGYQRWRWLTVHIAQHPRRKA